MNNPWIDLVGDSDVTDLCRRMTEIEKEMEAIHDKIQGLAKELNNSVKDKGNCYETNKM
jgi:hypothetical protein